VLCRLCRGPLLFHGAGCRWECALPRYIANCGASPPVPCQCLSRLLRAGAAIDVARPRCAGNHTAFMYIEDDDFLAWEALLGWAADQAPLAALGFTRSFARVETRADDGARTNPVLCF